MEPKLRHRNLELRFSLGILETEYTPVKALVNYYEIFYLLFFIPIKYTSHSYFTLSILIFPIPSSFYYLILDTNCSKTSWRIYSLSSILVLLSLNHGKEIRNHTSDFYFKLTSIFLWNHCTYNCDRLSPIIKSNWWKDITCSMLGRLNATNSHSIKSYIQIQCNLN